MSWKRVAIALAMVFGTLWLVGRVLERIHPWFESRRILRENPGVNSAPVAMPDTRVAKLTGSRFEFFGISVQTPWTGTIDAKLAGNMAIIPFPEHHITVLFYAPSTDSFETRLFAGIKSKPGSQTKLTHFGLKSAEMNATTQDLKWWRSLEKNEATSFLLEMKALNLSGSRVVYATQSGRLHGFQVGDPRLAPYKVRLDLYDADDQHYEMVWVADGAKPPAITQPEINGMVASIQKTNLKSDRSPIN